MKNLKKVISNINANKNLLKSINQSFYGNDLNEKIQMFIDNANRYIKATKESRMFCVIHHISKSGMSRDLSFFEHTFDAKHKQGNINTFHVLFLALGYKEASGGFGQGFKINGCGMDMVFHTNYTIIHQLNNLGFNMNCAVLSQNTPSKF
jgi:hypothetical protein